MKYRAGYKYQLAVGFETAISWHLKPPNGDIITKFLVLRKSPNKKVYLWIKPGYAWDGPSGPALDTPTAMTASLIHDALYQLIRQGALPNVDDITRHAADAEYHRYCKKAGMSCWRRWLHYRMLRKYAASAADPKNKREEIEVP